MTPSDEDKNRKNWLEAANQLLGELCLHPPQKIT